MKNMIEALINERVGYVRRGLKHRVAQVDELLKKNNIHVDVDVDVEVAAVESDVEQAAAPKKAKRTTR